MQSLSSSLVQTQSASKPILSHLLPTFDSGRKVACILCRRSHVRCDGSRPCERCIIRRTVNECLSSSKDSKSDEKKKTTQTSENCLLIPWCRWSLTNGKSILKLENWNVSYQELVWEEGAIGNTTKFESVFVEPFQSVKINSKCSGEHFTTSVKGKGKIQKRVLCTLWYYPEKDNYIDLKLQPLEEVHVLNSPQNGRSHLPSLIQTLVIDSTKTPSSNFPELTINPNIEIKEENQFQSKKRPLKREGEHYEKKENDEPLKKIKVSNPCSIYSLLN